MDAVAIKELRKEVRQYIDHADGRMLQAIRALLQVNQEKNIEIKDSWLEDMSEEEKASIERGLKQLDKGEGIPHDEAIKHLKWLPK